MADGRFDPSVAAVPAPLCVEAPFEVMAIESRTATIVELRLRPVEEMMAYLPGEYVLLEDAHHTVPPRSYSLANAPRTDGVISLLVTRVPHGGTSIWVHDRLQVGDTVSVWGPYGTFVDHPGATAPMLLLAAGSGLAPVRGLIEAALCDGANRTVTLIFSARTEADVIDRERFAQWQAQHERFRFIRTLTGGPGPPPRGRIPALLPELYRDLSEHELFVAGAPGFVQACATAADALGARRERVHTEVFYVTGDDATTSTTEEARS
ncbi:MAG TPA: FAD-binding oxidoreductase [Solirubrobacteraceae bacterium]|nr:FAD-binding oxidoreductase [Solirubrobacteraceae bacterium]